MVEWVSQENYAWFCVMNETRTDSRYGLTPLTLTTEMRWSPTRRTAREDVIRTFAPFGKDGGRDGLCTLDQTL